MATAELGATTDSLTAHTNAMFDGVPPAGKETRTLNASFSAYDYKPAKLDFGRSFLMDDYVRTGRVARHDPRLDGSLRHLKGDSCWDVIHYQQESQQQQFTPTQGFNETKFHKGFMRRQQCDIPRVSYGDYDRERVPRPDPHPTRHAAAAPSSARTP